jgi:hypothetical protein
MMTFRFNDTVIEVSLYNVFFRIPGVGEMFAGRGMGFTWSPWSEVVRPARAEAGRA